MPEHYNDGIISQIDREVLSGDAQDQRVKQLQAQREHIDRWFEKIKAAQKHDKFYRTRWFEDRRTARGDYDSVVSVNLISAIMDVLAAFLYAKNPDISIKPSESVDRARMTAYREFAKTIEIIASRMFKDAKLKKKAKRWIRGAQTVGIGWIKAIIQTRTEKEPLMASRINDLQDQIENIRTKQIRIKFTDEEEGVLISELESNVKAAEERLEISVAEGLVLDYMDPADVIVAPECGEVENYLEAPWIAFAAYKNEDEALAITGWKTEKEVNRLKTANRYTARPRKGDESDKNQVSNYVLSNEETESEDGFYLFYEIWSLDDGVVYTLIDGITEHWARDRYAPVTGKRYYPCFALAFHYIDGERYPQSDVNQLQKLQEEYNETRSDFRTHRKRAQPGVIFDQANVTPDSIKKIVAAVTEEYIGVDLLKPSPLDQVFFSKKYSPIDVGLYDTTPIQRDMEKMSGAQEALQSSIIVEKTATEAQIQEAGRGARTGARLDDLEESLTEMAEYVIQVGLQLLDQADAERYAGPSAVWLNLTTDEALTLFNITIKAGSTGKPKARTDREVWGTLLPLILDLIQKIAEARADGKEWAAKPIIALLKETLDRTDDHADIEMFVPIVPDEEIEAAAKPDPEAEAKVRLDTASSIDKAASAVEKLPSLVFSPEVRALLGIAEQQEPTIEALSGALQGSQQQLPAPDPI